MAPAGEGKQRRKKIKGHKGFWHCFASLLIYLDFSASQHGQKYFQNFRIDHFFCFSPSRTDIEKFSVTRAKSSSDLAHQQCVGGGK